MCIGGRLLGRREANNNNNNNNDNTEQIPVPLVGVAVNAKLIDFVAEVTINQRYQNIEEVPIEAIYEFPLPEGASIYNFFAVINGKKVEGTIKEKEKAKDQYDDAIAAGHSAFLLETKDENIFSTSVGNLPPKQEVLITIIYVTELNCNVDKKLEFSIRTNTSAYPDGNDVKRFYQSANTTVADQAPDYGLKVEVAFEMTSKIKSVTSPSHPIEYTSGSSPNHAKVTLANQEDVGIPLTKDFELRVALEHPEQPVFRVQDGVGMLALYPDLSSEDEIPISELIFVVDRSGSMSGSKMQSVRNTLHIFLRSLPLGTLFNIIGFGSNYKALFEGSQEYNDDTLAVATTHVNNMDADLGGTVLFNPLSFILQQKPRAGIPRQLFVLTDGAVDNTEDCIQFVREHSDTTRVFAFGIEGASPTLVNGIAKAGEGKAELIARGENVESKVMAQLQRALQPALTDLRVDWGPLAAEQTPFKLPPLFSGSRVIVYGFVPPNAKPGKVILSATSAKGQLTFEHTVTEEDLKPFVGGESFIPKLAARSLIRDLEENRSAAQAVQTLTQQQVVQKIVDLSIQSGILSKHTAFVGVSENVIAITKAMETRRVGGGAHAAAPKMRYQKSFKKTISPEESRRMREETSNEIRKSVREESVIKKRGRAPVTVQSQLAKKKVVAVEEDDTENHLESFKEKSQLKRKRAVGGSVDYTVQQPNTNAVKDIVMKQRAGGNFPEEALTLFGTSLSALRSLVPQELTSLPSGLLDQILITLYICGMLRKKYNAESDQWILVEKKALHWVKQEIKKSNDALGAFNWNSLAVSLAV